MIGSTVSGVTTVRGCSSNPRKFVSRLGKDGYVLGSIHGGLILDVRLWR
jgi:hypothetical protein